MDPTQHPGFVLILRGGGAAAVAPLARALMEELASRGIAARVLSDGPAAEGVRAVRPEELASQAEALRAAGASAVALWTGAAEVSPLAQRPDAVVIDWPATGGERASRGDSHGSIPPGAEAHAGLAAAFEILEGLGHVPIGGQTLSAEQDAELVERLKELGYV